MSIAEPAPSRELQELRTALEGSLECSITCERFVDPVLAPDGHTYERSAIEAWLAEHGTSPLSGEAMPEGELRPNWVVKGLIQSPRLQVEVPPSN
jgi:hypothetical protein